jgi:small-conductance mechanosensitive channel/CRP-like cAMP-binding protein
MQNQLWNSILHGDAVVVFASCVLVGLSLSFLLRSQLDGPQRVRLRAPVIMLLMAAAAWLGLELWQPRGAATRTLLRLGPLLLALLAYGRLATVAVFDWLLNKRLRQDVPRIVRDIAESALALFALLVVLRTAGVEAVPLVTTSAVITAIVALSLQDTLGNLFAGLALQAQRPFEVGEWIQIDREGLQVGQVLEVNWRATKVLTVDNQELNVPNNQLARAPILNLSRPGGHLRRSVDVLVSHDTPPRLVCGVLERALLGATGVLEQPKPRIWTHGFVDQGIRYRVLYHITDFSQREDIDAGIRDRLWYALRRAGLVLARGGGIPFNTTAPGAAERDLDARRRAIRQIDFLRDLPDSAVETLAVDARTELYAPGEVVVRQGEAGQDLYLCLSGELVVLLTLEDGRHKEVARIGLGGMFGEFAQVTGESRAATVQTVSACELVAIGKSAFTAVLGGNPEFAEAVSQRLAERRAELDAAGEVSPSKRPSVDEHKGRFLQRLREFLAL